MDRVIYNTTVLIIGTVSDAVYQKLNQAKLEVLQLEKIAPEIRITKLIRYAAGNAAGIFGLLPDGMKLIVNTHVIIIGPEAAEALRTVLSEADICGVAADDSCKALVSGGSTLPGVYLAGEGYDPSDAVFYAGERLNHFALAGKVMNRPREMHIGGEYELDILRPKLKKKHRLLIRNENGVLSGTHITENDTQPMQNLEYRDGYLTWNAYSGTTGSELFRYRLELFDDILLGATWRVDGERESSFKSPVVVERISKEIKDL